MKECVSVGQGDLPTVTQALQASLAIDSHQSSVLVSSCRIIQHGGLPADTLQPLPRVQVTCYSTRAAASCTAWTAAACSSTCKTAVAVQKLCLERYTSPPLSIPCWWPPLLNLGTSVGQLATTRVDKGLRPPPAIGLHRRKHAGLCCSAGNGCC